MPEFVFKNKDTQELRRQTAVTLNQAAHWARINVPVSAPWTPWECWGDDGKCFWHYDDNGNCIDGARPVKTSSGFPPTPGLTAAVDTVIKGHDHAEAKRLENKRRAEDRDDQWNEKQRKAASQMLAALKHIPTRYDLHPSDVEIMDAAIAAAQAAGITVEE